VILTPLLTSILAAGLFAAPSATPSAYSPQFNWAIANEKRVKAAEDVEYHKYYLKVGRGGMNMHTVTIGKDAGFALMPVISNGLLNSVSPVKGLADKVGAVAAINGGFFDTGKTRLPVGLVKIKRRIVFEQFLNRAVLGIDEQGQLHFDRFTLHSSIYIPGVNVSTPIHGYNRKRKAGELIVYTPEFGHTTKTNEWGVDIILHRISPEDVAEPFILLEPDRYIITGVNHMDTTIPSDGVVLSIHKPALEQLGWLNEVYLGMEMQLKSNVPQGWDSFPYLLGGGPLLLRQGEVVLDPKAERFGSYFNSPKARTAVGRTAKGDSVIIVVDSGASGGATWDELAVLCRDMLGLSDAMGFDGGGSSTLFVNDEIVNAPSGGGQRSVANILAVVPLDRFI
jgi:Phosphodiester glycosidase